MKISRNRLLDVDSNSNRNSNSNRSRGRGSSRGRKRVVGWSRWRRSWRSQKRESGRGYLGGSRE